MIPNQQALDRLTRQDELLAQMIPILEQIRDKDAASLTCPPATPSGDLAALLALQQQQHDIDFNVFTLTYPRDGTRLTIAAGTTTFDFLAGTVAAPGVAVADMGNSLGLQRKEFMRALFVNADKAVVVRIGSGDRMPIRAGVHPTFPFRQFTTVEVTCTEDTEILILASTSSAAIIQMGGEISPSTAGFTGDVYENEHTMTTDAAYTFEASSVLLRDVIIRVSTFDALIGDSANQRYPRSVGSTLGFLKVDLSKLYIKNAGAGSNTKVNILGTRL